MCDEKIIQDTKDLLNDMTRTMAQIAYDIELLTGKDMSYIAFRLDSLFEQIERLGSENV